MLKRGGKLDLPLKQSRIKGKLKNWHPIQIAISMIKSLAEGIR